MAFLYRFLFLGLLLVPATVLPARDQPPESEYSCGLNAAYIYLNRAGHHVAYEELSGDFSGQPCPSSLLAIEKVLEMHGCRTVGLKTDAGYFLKNAGPAIVYLQLSGFSPKNENHFSYLADATRQNGVQLLDPIFDLRNPSFISWDGFIRIYQGIALVPQ
jgi:hypothetical protein